MMALYAGRARAGHSRRCSATRAPCSAPSGCRPRAHRPPVFLVHGDADDSCRSRRCRRPGLQAAEMPVQWSSAADCRTASTPDGIEHGAAFLAAAFGSRRGTLEVLDRRGRAGRRPGRSRTRGRRSRARPRARARCSRPCESRAARLRRPGRPPAGPCARSASTIISAWLGGTTLSSRPWKRMTGQLRRSTWWIGERSR